MQGQTSKKRARNALASQSLPIPQSLMGPPPTGLKIGLPGKLGKGWGKKNAWVWQQYEHKPAGSKASKSSSSADGQESGTADAGDSNEEEEGEGQQDAEGLPQKRKAEYHCKHCSKWMSGLNENRMKLHLINLRTCSFLDSVAAKECTAEEVQNILKSRAGKSSSSSASQGRFGAKAFQKAVMSVMGGPKKTEVERTKAFGSSAVKTIPRKPLPRPKGRMASATANGHAGPPMPPSHFASVPEGTAAQKHIPLSKSMGAAASLQALTRPGTSPMKNRGASTGPPTAQSSAANTRPNTAQSATTTMTGRKVGRASAAAEARRAAEAEEQLRQQHWRVRVSRAQRRLYLYLRTYMAWISILKKKRKGYAEPFAIEDLPVILATSLGDNQAQFGGFLKTLERQLATGGQQESGAWLGGVASKWKALAAPRHSSKGDLGMVRQPSMGRRRSSSHGVAWGPQRTADATHVPPGASIASKGRRQTARSLAPAGLGGAATVAAHVAPHKPALDSAANGQRATPGAQQLDPSLSAAYGGRSGSFKQRGGRKSLLDIVAASVPKGEGVFKTFKHRDAQTDRSVIEKSGEAKNLQLLVNKANARWVERHLARGKQWTDPHVVDSKKLRNDGLDMDMYEQVSRDLLTQGKLALQMVYLGEEQAVGVGSGIDPRDTKLVPACTVDLWDVMSTHFSNKVPLGSRITGLTLLDRRILQSLMNVEVQAGRSAVSHTVLVLCVDANVVKWVSEQAVAKHHWGLQEDQIIIVSIERFPGITWEPESRIFQVEYCHDVPYSSANSGYALLALNWPSHAFTVSKGSSGTGSSAGAGLPLLRNYIAGSVLKHLEQRGVQYLYSSRMCDFEALNPQSPSPDPGFCGPAIYAMDTQGANMAMQVVQGGTDTRARWLNSVVMAPGAGSNFCCNVAMTDMQTASTRAIVQSLNKQQGHLYSCTSRYLFKVQTLKTALTGPTSFHFKLQVKGSYAFLYMDVADVTSNLGANCVAILAQGPTRGPEPLTMAFSKHWIRDSSSTLVQQEAQPSFRARAIACLGHASSLLPGSSPTSHSAMANGAATDPWATSRSGAISRSGARMLLLVRDNQASRNAYRLACQLIKLPGDVLILVHVVSALAATKEAETLLASFTSAMKNAQTKRRVVHQKEEGLVETVQHQVDELKPDLLVLGSEHLVHVVTKGHNQSFKTPRAVLSQQVVSFALAVARSVTEVSLLVVKSNSAGELFNEPDTTSPALRIMVEAQTVSASLLQWLLPRMSPLRDQLYLARPQGLDQANQVTPQTQRLLNTLSIEAAAPGRTVRKVPMRESHTEGLPPVVVKESIDILGLIAPSAKITPPHILDIIRTARTNVLVWRKEQRAGL